MFSKRLTELIAVLIICQTTTFAQSSDNVIDEVIWVVGDEAILKSDVEETRINAQMEGMHFDGDPYCVIPEQLAVQKLFLHQAAEDSVEVTDSEVWQQTDSWLDNLVQVIGSREKLEQYFGKTMTQLREERFEAQKDMMLVREVQSNLIKNTKVTPTQVRNYFKTLPEDSLPFIPTTVEVQIITRAPEITQAEIDNIKADLRSYTERINSGKDKFSTLAILYSEDGSASKGGELGFMGRADLVPEFANVAFSLTDPNTVSKIVETEYGFHIIQLIEKRGDRINVRHILRKPKPTDEAIEQGIHFLDSVANDIREGKYTFEQAVPYLSDDKNTNKNYGIMVYKDPESYGVATSKFEMVNLPTAIARVVTNMNVGEISNPFTMVNDQGKEVVAIVKLKNRTNGHRATMKDDYQALQTVMVNKLNEEKIDKWIRDKQKTTYIRINEVWRNCEFKYPGWIKE